ncbi:methyl-accepting chemotaxis protein [Cohnella thailandensis]|uniref:Methyl-accepting chemotaxis protein n=1 Tax=Cohnella thailandensis TaxID=557557 RepID=A0A841T580_9BACL|nr:methyl-accepting chemotaxis protein [Cohnella thailandensis]MBB6637017.1 methyl-accepting chemotaxis protein [Cohnella thailandensis]MBP1973099.1 methyl-accepting chemotaxis protein [Cohnella thailandensis]
MNGTVRRKMFSVFASIFLLFALSAIVSILGIRAEREHAKEVTTHWLNGVETVNQIKVGLSQFQNQYYQLMLESDENQKSTYTNMMGTLVESVGQLVDSYESAISNEEDRSNYELLRQHWGEFRKSFSAASGGSNGQSSEEASAQGAVSFQQANEVLDRMIEFNHNGAMESSEKGQEQYRLVLLVTIGITVLALVLLASIAFILIRNITRPLLAAQEAMRRISSGDLTVEKMAVNRKDEFGKMMESLNGTVQHLKASVERMQDSAGDVASTADQLYASSDQNTSASQHVAEMIMQVASDAEKQAAVTGEMERVVEEMAEGVQRIAETTSEVADLSGSASQSAGDGVRQIRLIVDRMQSLRQSVQQASADLRRMEEQARQIGRFSALIGEIAAQTHLLALNAAIEASHAGEHGSGFAVVAGEVRKLAAQTDESVHNITELSKEVEASTVQAVLTMKRGLDEVQLSVAAVESAESTLDSLARSAQDVNLRIQEAAAAAEQLSASSEEVAASIVSMGELANKTASTAEQVAGATEQQLASSEEISASSQMLSTVAAELQDLVRTFRLDITHPHK